jgi:hypothetical protein
LHYLVARNKESWGTFRELSEDDGKGKEEVTLLTFMLPFYPKGKGRRAPIGVIALDVVYDEALRSSITKADDVRV